MRSRECRVVDLGDVGDESARLVRRLVQLNLVGELTCRERAVSELLDLADEVPHLGCVAEDLHVRRLVPSTVLVGLVGTEANHRRGAEGSIDRLLESVNRDVGRNKRDEEHSGDCTISILRKIYFNFLKGARGRQSNEVGLLQS
jgi:hypothetical protein